MEEFSDKELTNYQIEELLQMELMRYRKIPDQFMVHLERSKRPLILSYYSALNSIQIS